jgi:hypothetical protein
MLLFDIKPISDEEAEPDLPRYSDKGRILFRFWPIANEEPNIEVLGYDGSAMWINEGLGCEYFLKDLALQIELDGVYVTEGGHGECWKDYFGEYDEEWYFDFIRRASPEEEEQEALFDD